MKSPELLPGFITSPEKRRFNEAVRTLDQAVQEIVQAFKNTSDQPNAHDHHLLAAMLHLSDGAAPMTDQQIRDELVTILIAGHETVASALTWSFYLLAQNPMAEARLRQELEQVLKGRTPRAEDLPAFDYTRRVFDEALRLYPPAWLVTRKSLQADTIGGVTIPENSLIVISITNVHMNPTYWPDPHRFDPDRFLPEVAASRPRLAYLPFGAGPRLCIGNHLALTEAPLILAAIYQNYHLEMDPGQKVVMDPLVTLRPHGGLQMRVMKKSSDPSENLDLNQSFQKLPRR